MLPSHFVSYYRVSTQQQGQSGLGLAAQRQSVARFLGDTGALLAEFTEVETGKAAIRQTPTPINTRYFC